MPLDGGRRKQLAIGGGVAAVVLAVATALSISHSEPTLAPAPPVTTAPPTTGTTLPVLPSDETVPTTATTAPATPTQLSVLPAKTSEVATVKAGVDEVTVYGAATGDDVSQTVEGVGDYGQQQVFLVLGEQDGRLDVLLPVRPNGSRGWIDPGVVDVASHDYQIQVSLSGFRMMVQQGSEVVIDTAIGVGTEDTPTVGGDFYTWVLIAPTNSGYGSYAYGLSGFSTLEQFAGGDGRMGIHGTADESTIGTNVSHGCVRVPDDVVVEMVEDIGLPLGVPVTVVA